MTHSTHCRMARFALGLLVPLALASGAAQAQDMLVGTAEAVDGRSLRIGATVVQLADIDAPGPKRSCALDGRNYPCGALARAALADLLTGALTECRIVRRPAGAPPIAECLADGFDLSLNMVHTGWAYADTTQSNRYSGIENAARTAKRGLWRGEFERHDHRKLTISGE